MSDQTTQDLETTSRGAYEASPDVLALVILWSAEEPERAGEVAFVGAGRRVLGRGEQPGKERLRFAPQRPGPVVAPRAIEGRGISREQLHVERKGDTLEVTRVGRCALSVDGLAADSARAQPGACLALDRQLSLLVVRRPAVLRPPPAYPLEASPFGRADALGILGESPAAWALRAQIAFVAQADRHVLVTGPSGSGKELAARAVHALSRRARGPFVARNAATLPPSLVDAELFGNRRDYPNPGMQERPGLIGAAHEGTLFFDEIGETSPELQAHLLRVLDAGEYHRLGEERLRRSDVRVVAATNRDVSELKHDLAARLMLRVDVPGLDARPEDIPLLARAIVLRAASEPGSPAARFVDDGRSGPIVKIAPRLVEALTRHRYTLHVRELEGLLWRAMETSSGATIDLTPAVGHEVRHTAAATSADASPAPSREEVVVALEEAAGNQTRAAKALGLTSRFALYRLLKKYGIEAG